MKTKVYINIYQNIQTNVYHKETNQQNYLHRKSEHPLCLKKSISFSQELKLKRICSTISAFEDESTKLIQKFMEQGYEADDIKERVDR